MFTTYIDDSGSAPEHKVVVASALVIPNIKISRMESEWKSFLSKENIEEFHTSECVARNHKTSFATWDEIRVQKAFARIRQITVKYAARAFCILIHKDLYDEVMPKDMKERVGSYYTWALSSVLGLADDFARARNVSMNYVFDNADKTTKREVDEAIRFSETRLPGHYSFTNHYSFGNRKEVSALQAADLFAWTCFQQGRRARLGHTLHPLAEETWREYGGVQQGEWAVVQSLNREGIERWVKAMYGSPEDLSLKDFKESSKLARIPKRKIKSITPTTGRMDQ